MSTKSPFDLLPNEILLEITSYLGSHHLRILSRTCKGLNRYVEPLLWSNIELHKPSYHASSVEPSSAPPIRPAFESRWYTEEYWSFCLDKSKKSNKAEAFFAMLQLLHKDDPQRLKQVARRVKSLCTVIAPHWRLDDTQNDTIQPLQLLPYFTNLKRLELHGNIAWGPKYEQITPEIAAPALQLRIAKLFGYIPRTVVAWLLKSGKTLEWLELGLLDHPIYTGGDSQVELQPPPEEQSDSQMDGQGDEDDSDQGDEDDRTSDNGSIHGKDVPPRPLGGFLPNSCNLQFPSEPALPKLKHLHLWQPGRGNYGQSPNPVSWSAGAERACLADWREILLAASDTLEVLVLEQRPVIDLSWVIVEGWGEEEFIANDHRGRGNKALVHTVQRLFVEGALANLKQVYLYGMVVTPAPKGGLSDRVPADRFMRFLASRQIKCEARVGHWLTFDDAPRSTYDWELAGWMLGTEGDEEDEEENSYGESKLLASV